MQTPTKLKFVIMSRGASTRESFVQKALEPKRVLKTMLRYGFKSFGTLDDQIQSYQYKFVDQEQWINDSQYKQIVDVCNSLPGATPIQIIILIATLCSKSPWVGFAALLAFSLPSAILLCLFGVFMNEFVKNYDKMPVQVRLVILGFKASGGALLFRRAVDTIHADSVNSFTFGIVGVASIVYYLYPTTKCVQASFILGAIISLYIKTQKKTKLSKNAKAIMKNMKKYSWIFGKWAIIFLVGIYAFLGLHFRIDPSDSYYFVYVFYFVGCFIFGPGSTLFPVIYPQFIETGQMTNDQFWFGVPLTFLVPGSPTNVSAYYGTIVHGVPGAILGWLFLHLPAVLIIFGILPNWAQYRDRAGIQRIIIGMNCITVGFLVSSGLLALESAIVVDTGIPIVLFILSFFLSFIGCPNYLIIIVSGILANTRRWGLVDFRMVPEPDY